MVSPSLEEKYKSVLETIKLYPDQFRQAWDEVGAIEIPDDYKSIDKIVLCGMGGSALGGRAADSLIFGKLNVSFENFNKYHIPHYSNKNTLVIVSSYSGNTEEAISSLKEAVNKKTKIFVIAAGGTLKELAKENNLPRYIINPSFNPSNQPRNAIGYSFGAVLSLLNSLGLVSISEREIDGSIKAMADAFNEFSADGKNAAIELAQKLNGKGAIIVSSEHLYEIAHTTKNQLNESAKTFSVHFELPEINHHLMEGLAYPKQLKSLLIFVFIESDLYSDRINLRYPLTKEIIGKNGYDHFSFRPKTKHKMHQVFETLIFGSMVVYYLSKYYGIDPNAIPYVDYFKKQLAMV